MELQMPSLRTGAAAISSTDYRTACQFHRKNLGRTDEVLYRLCRQHAAHDRQDWVHTKVLLIGRGFATGIERQVRATSGPGSAIWQVSVLLHENGRTVDRILASVSGVSEPFDKIGVDGLRALVSAHGKFCVLLKQITGTKTAPSFASKYLHFHRPIVPMYDQWAYDRAWAYRPRQWQVEGFRAPKQAEGGFACYVQCFWHVYRSLREAPGLSGQVSVRLVESFLGGLAG